MKGLVGNFRVGGGGVEIPNPEMSANKCWGDYQVSDAKIFELFLVFRSSLNYYKICFENIAANQTRNLSESVSERVSQ